MWRGLPLLQLAFALDAAAQAIPVGAASSQQLLEETSLTFGGELRERFEAAENPRFGIGQRRDSVLLHRVLVHADLNVSSQLRFFGQLGYSEQSGRNAGPAPTDVNRLDLTQAFVALAAPIGEGRSSLRIGRQELSFGSSRLVSVRDGPNVRRSFDAIRASWSNDRQVRAEAFTARPLTIEPGRFDDESDRAESLQGVYLTGPVSDYGAARVDLYFLRYRRDQAVFLQTTSSERRQTVGMRFFGQREGADWDIELAAQGGSFGHRSIRAWTFAAHIGYRFKGTPFRPRLGLKADVASGDRDPADGHLGTFNALYPRLTYFSDANLVAPANLADLHPSIELDLGSRVTLALGWNVLWRMTAADAVYGTPLTAVPNTAGRRGCPTGQQAIVDLQWQASPSTIVTAGYVHFRVADALRQAGGANVNYLKLSTTLKF